MYVSLLQFSTWVKVFSYSVLVTGVDFPLCLSGEGFRELFDSNTSVTCSTTTAAADGGGGDLGVWIGVLVVVAAELVQI